MAEFGTYTQYACHLPDGTVASTEGFWRMLETQDACATNGAMRLRMPSDSDPSDWKFPDSWNYVPAADTAVVGVMVQHTQSGLGGDTEMRYQMVNTSDICDPTHACANPTDYTWDAPLDQLQFNLACITPTSTCVAQGGAAEATVDISRVVVQLRDTAAPQFSSSPAGTLLGARVTGVQSVNFAATDSGGGVYQAALLVDGVEQPRQIVDDNNGWCRPPFAHQVPCKTSASGQLSFDTTTLSDGQHTFGVVVYDATGTNNITFGPVPVEVDNVPDSATTASGSGAESPSKASAARLVAISRPDRQPFAKSGVAKGKLVDDEGKPIGGAVVDIYSSVDVPNAPVQLVGQATTKADGTFGFAIPKGPSRRFTVKDRKTGATWNFTVTVPAPIKLNASRAQLKNGKKLMLTAYMAGERVPAKSAAVAFQVLIGHQWRTFATRNIGASGSARVGHRFKVTFQRLTYRFRAVVVGRSAFPFGNATSPHVDVIVN